MPMRASGAGKFRSFIYGVLSGVVEPAGALLTILAAPWVVPVLPYLLSLAAGAMIYVVVEELIPKPPKAAIPIWAPFFFAAGFTLMMILDVTLG